MLSIEDVVDIITGGVNIPPIYSRLNNVFFIGCVILTKPIKPGAHESYQLSRRSRETGG